MRRIRLLWQKPLIRKAAAAGTFLGVVLLQVFFKNFPWPLRL